MKGRYFLYKIVNNLLEDLKKLSTIRSKWIHGKYIQKRILFFNSSEAKPIIAMQLRRLCSWVVTVLC